MRAWMSRGDSEDAPVSDSRVGAGAEPGTRSRRSAVDTRSSMGSARRRPTSSASTNAWPSSERATNRTGRIAILRPLLAAAPPARLLSFDTVRAEPPRPGAARREKTELQAFHHVVDAGSERLDITGFDRREHRD